MLKGILSLFTSGMVLNPMFLIGLAGGAYMSYYLIRKRYILSFLIIRYMLWLLQSDLFILFCLIVFKKGIAVL